MIKLSEILSGIETKVSFTSERIIIEAFHNKKPVGKLTIGTSHKKHEAVVLAADTNPQRQGIGTALYREAKKVLENLRITALWGALEGSGIIQIREKVFGPGKTHYFSGKEIDVKKAIHIMDVNYGRVLAKTEITPKPTRS